MPIHAIPEPEAVSSRLALLGHRRHIDGRFHHGLDRWDSHIFAWLISGHEGRIMPDRCDGQLAEDVAGATVAASETERSDGDEDAHSDLRRGRQIGPMRNDPSPTTAYSIFATSRPDGLAVIPVPAVTNQVPNVTIPDEILNVIVLGGGFDRFRNHVSDLPRVHARGEIERSRALSSRLHCTEERSIVNA